jgi:hypothetical protein
MIRPRLAAIVAGIVLSFAGTAAAHATPALPVQVKIYLENNNHNPGTVTADCGLHGAVLHTALFNDAVGANVVETARIYREDTGAVVFGPVDVAIGGHVAVDMPYLPGVTFNAYAVPKGDPWPATQADAIARLSANPPTADNSQLFPSGYPADPKCPPPLPNPCDVKPAGIDLKVLPTCPPCPTTELTDAAAIAVVPTCVPATKPSTEPSHTRTSSKPGASSPGTTTSSSPAATSPVSTTSSPPPPPSPTGTAPTAMASPPLAHTGATVVPVAIGALVLLAAGGAFVVATRRARRH